MYVVVTSVVLLFALIFLGFYIGKRGIVRQESTPDLSNLILRVTMPVTVFCSIVGQKEGHMAATCGEMFLAMLIFHTVSMLIGFLVVKALHIPEKNWGNWIYTIMFSNNGFMGLPLALSIYGNKGMFLMAISNVISNLLIFSVGIKLLTWKYPVKEKLSLRKMFVNNINIAVVLGLIFSFAHIPVPDLLGQLLTYLSNITSGLSMLVVGLSLSRLPLKGVFADRKMLIPTAFRLIVIPVLTILVIRLLPFQLDQTFASVIILASAMPASAAQSMVTEQYQTDTASAGRSVFLTTLFSLLTVPLIMLLAL